MGLALPEIDSDEEEGSKDVGDGAKGSEEEGGFDRSQNEASSGGGKGRGRAPIVPPSVPQHKRRGKSALNPAAARHIAEAAKALAVHTICADAEAARKKSHATSGPSTSYAGAADAVSVAPLCPPTSCSSATVKLSVEEIAARLLNAENDRRQRNAETLLMRSSKRAETSPSQF